MINMDGDVRPNLNNRDGNILCIEASYKYEEWFGIRDIGMKIEKKAEDVGQDLKLDNLTRGAGNCFPVAILQQLNRNEIKLNLDSKLKEIASAINHIEFRTKVVAFMLKSKLPHVLNYRTQVEVLLGIKWSKYCGIMIKKGKYVDSHFIQCTAWYLKMDIWILEEGATQSQPFVKICGEAGSNAQVLYIGLADEHYQSLLPKSVEMVEENQIEEESLDFNEMKICPVCGKECNKVLMHLSRAKACKEAFGIDKLKELVTKNEKEKYRKHRAKRRAESPEGYKKEIKAQRAKHRQVERTTDEESLKEKMKTQQAKHREVERIID